jgi:hypothetical protein
MRPNFVEIALPIGQHQAGVPDGAEQRLVQAFIAQLANEALHERVLLRLAGCDVVPAGLAFLAPVQDRGAGQLGAVIADDCGGIPPPGRNRVQLARDAPAG